MTVIPDRTLDRLVDLLRARGKRWDEPPELYYLFDRGGDCHPCEFPAPPGAWAHPPEFLDALAQQMKDVPNSSAPPTPPNFYGVAFVFEAWTARKPPPGDPARYRAWEEACRTRTLDLYPDRVEARLVLGMEKAGHSFVVRQPRGGAIDTYVLGPAFRGGQLSDLDGRIVRSLRSLLGTFVGRMPAAG